MVKMRQLNHVVSILYSQQTKNIYLCSTRQSLSFNFQEINHKNVTAQTQRNIPKCDCVIEVVGNEIECKC